MENITINKRVYFCDIDYIYTKDAAEFDTLGGGAVYVFVKAYDVREALLLLEKDLKDRKMDAREIVSVAPYDVNKEWASEEERLQYLYLYTECDKINGIVYDDFLAYEKEK